MIAVPARGQLDAAAWTRILAAVGVCAGLVSLLFILQYTRFPYEANRLYIFDYLFRSQDVVGAALVTFIALAAALPGTSRPALALVDAMGRNPWPTAAAAFLALVAAQLLLVQDHALAGDEHLALLQAKAFAAGRIAAQFPPELLSWVVVWPYRDLWLYASPDGTVVSVYWPGWSLVLAPFSLVGATWACNPLLLAGSLVLMARLAVRFTGAAAAGGWTLLLALASPAFTGMALSYFSMTAHLFLNLAFAWLLLERSPRRLLAAGAVGSLALILNNPLPHLLFALPWIAWIGWREGRRPLLLLAAGYAPLALLGGLGWWLFMREVQGHLWFAPYPPDGEPANRLGNFLFSWQLQFSRVFVEPGWKTFTLRAGEQVKLWLWTVPGLPALALAGWWALRRLAPANLLGLSLACSVLGYLPVWFDQGYGWGVRYLHPALGALPVLGAAALVAWHDAAARGALVRYFASAALLSLILASALRGAQIHAFMTDHLSRRPAFESGKRQLVFVRLNWPYYTQDFIQNDPFLRAPVIFLLSRGRQADEELLRKHFPTARHVHDAPFGHVWRLD